VDALAPLLRDFGFPVALCVALLWAIREQNRTLVKAYTDRIGTLERIVRDLTAKVDDLERDRIRRADEYGHTLKGIALSWANATKETNELVRGSLAVQRRVCDFIGGLAHERAPPHAVPPSSREVPADPTTDRTTGRA